MKNNKYYERFGETLSFIKSQGYEKVTKGEGHLQLGKEIIRDNGEPMWEWFSIQDNPLEIRISFRSRLHRGEPPTPSICFSTIRVQEIKKFLNSERYDRLHKW